MKKRWYLLVLPLVILFSVSCGSGSETDGDTDGDSENTTGIEVGLPCSSDAACSTNLCYPFSDELKACSTTCSSDSECIDLSIGTCCQTTKENQNICYPASLCSPSCDYPGENRCFGNDVYTCSDQGRLVSKTDCTEDGKICSGGECMRLIDGDTDDDWNIPDGDQEDDVEEEAPVYECGNPCQSISFINQDATNENFFMISMSNPEEKASVYTVDTELSGLPAGFIDAKYAKLTLDSVTSGPLDNENNVQELVFLLDIDYTYKYDFKINYVCGKNWGQTSLFIDNVLIKRQTDISELQDYVDLQCTPAVGFEEKSLGDPIAYKTVCLEKGEHKVQVRVIDKKSTSNGYTIGVDQFLILPSTEYKDEFCETQL